MRKPCIFLCSRDVTRSKLLQLEFCRRDKQRDQSHFAGRKGFISASLPGSTGQSRGRNSRKEPGQKLQQDVADELAL